MDWLRYLAAALLLGCHMDPVPDRGPGTGPTTVQGLPTDPPVPIAVPGPPPAPAREEALACEDGQVWVPGQWEWAGEWAWCSGYCALGQAGYAYVAPRYENGVYLRGHFALIAGAGPLVGLKPAYRRYVHPDGIVFGPRVQRAEAPPQQAADPQPPLYFWGGPFGAPHGQRHHRAPFTRRDADTSERPPPPPRGMGERP